MKKKDTKSDVKQTPMPTTLFDEKEKKGYQTGSALGTGGFARVFQVTETASGTTFANKVIDKGMFKEKRSAKEKVEREIKIHRELNHKNVVKFFNYFEDKSFVHLLLELCPQKTLLHVSKYRKKVEEEEARYYANQITQGLNFLHSKGILHRDLKLGNMFLSDQMVVKIGDFGLASAFIDNKAGSMCGTPNYIAPEVLRKEGHSPASEVWSLGCMIFALLCGAPPFETESVASTYSRIAAGTFSLPPSISTPAASFLRSLLAHNPDQRPTLASLLLHPFMLLPTPSSLPSYALTQLPPASDLVQTKETPSQFLQCIISALEECLKRKEGKTQSATNHLPAHVTKWADYSARFGFSCLLSDGTICVDFVDGSMVTKKGKKVEYKDPSGNISNASNLSQVEDELLAKRLKLLGFFSRYLAEKVADHRLPVKHYKNVELDIGALRAWRRDEEHVSLQLDGLIQVEMLRSASRVLLWRLKGAPSLTIVTDSRVETYQLQLLCDSSILGLINNSVLPQVRSLAGV